MNKNKETFGVDISKDVFDVDGSISGHNQFKNNEKSFKSYLKILPENSIVVMEATGYYHYRLAQFLYKNNVAVSVVNPLSVKRFIQMKLAKVKTDKRDAQMIYQYAKSVELKLWQGKSENQIECLQIISALSVYTKQGTALKNKIHGESVLGNPSTIVLRSLKRSLKSIQKEVVLFEKSLLKLVKSTIRNY